MVRDRQVNRSSNCFKSEYAHAVKTSNRPRPLISCAFLLLSVPMFWHGTLLSQKKVLVYAASQAIQRIGESATIRGRFNQVFHSRTETEFLNIDSVFPAHSFSAAIFKADLGKFIGLDAYTGKTTEVTGKIKSYHGKAEIILKSSQQLKNLE